MLPTDEILAWLSDSSNASLYRSFCIVCGVITTLATGLSLYSASIAAREGQQRASPPPQVKPPLQARRASAYAAEKTAKMSRKGSVASQASTQPQKSNRQKFHRALSLGLFAAPFTLLSVFFFVDPLGSLGVLPATVSSLLWSLSCDLILIGYLFISTFWARLADVTGVHAQSVNRVFIAAGVLMALAVPFDVAWHLLGSSEESSVSGVVLLVFQWLLATITYTTLMVSTHYIVGFIDEHQASARVAESPLAKLSKKLKMFRSMLTVPMIGYTIFIGMVVLCDLGSTVGGFFVIYGGITGCYVGAAMLVFPLSGPSLGLCRGSDNAKVNPSMTCMRFPETFTA